MKKFFYVLLAVTLPMMFVACGSDDDDAVNENEVSVQALQGNWVAVQYDGEIGTCVNLTVKDDNIKLLWTYYEPGSVILGSDMEECKFQKIGSQFVLTGIEIDEKLPVNISMKGDKMVLSLPIDGEVETYQFVREQKEPYSLIGGRWEGNFYDKQGKTVYDFYDKSTGNECSYTLSKNGDRYILGSHYNFTYSLTNDQILINGHELSFKWVNQLICCIEGDDSGAYLFRTGDL